jgi:mycothiol system anti-sigma-R factor
MKCRQALKLLYEYLDNQLDNKTVDDVKQHLSECKHCFETYTFEEHLNDMLKAKSGENAPEVVDRLKEQVVHRIKQLSDGDEPVSEEEKGKSRGFFLFRRPVLAIGFMAIVAIISFIAFLSVDKSNAWAESFIQSHQLAVNGEMPMDISTLDIDSLKICLSEKMNLPRRVFNPSNGYQVHSGKVDLTSEQRPLAQILYDVNGHEVSIFVMNKSDFRRPGNMSLVRGTVGTYAFRYNGSCVYVWNCRDFWYVATSDLDDGSMIDFVSHFNYVAEE